jgi:hypothetical protein
VDSWEYPADFVILQPKTHLWGHPLIMGRPWLATTDSFICFRSGSMTLFDGYNTKKMTLYHHATPSEEPANSLWMDTEDESALPVLTIGKSLSFKDETEEKLINFFICDSSSITRNMHHRLIRVFDPIIQEDMSSEMFSETTENQNDLAATTTIVTKNVITTDDETTELFPKFNSKNIVVEIEPGKTLNINPDLSTVETCRLMKLLIEHKEAFSWDYMDMKGISYELCTHHIYIKEECRPIFQPERRMNPNLKEIVKEEFQKLLNDDFIYPISDNEWISPLVIVPKKNGKWRVCVDYKALNKSTRKDHFPLPFIDQVLDNLAGKKFFSFLDGFNGYNQIKIAPQDQSKITFTNPWGTVSYKVLPFGLCNAPTTFQRVLIGIFSDMVNDCMEISMDEFTPYGIDFDEALANLEKVLKICIQSHLSLST